MEESRGEKARRRTFPDVTLSRRGARSARRTQSPEVPPADAPTRFCDTNPVCRSDWPTLLCDTNPKSRPGPMLLEGCEANPIFWELPASAAIATQTQFVEGRGPATVPRPLCETNPNTGPGQCAGQACETNPIEECSTPLVDMRLPNICEETTGIARSSTREGARLASFPG